MARRISDRPDRLAARVRGGREPVRPRLGLRLAPAGAADPLAWRATLLVPARAIPGVGAVDRDRRSLLDRSCTRLPRSLATPGSGGLYCFGSLGRLREAPGRPTGLLFGRRDASRIHKARRRRLR